ncbi:kinase-like domain-containing protein [Rhizophagus irregularis DAOM 181602=DAOM 197198]|uniref:Kinase-like domain-containing protein n=1 Tax=Rhizophagus irregularis (strain DAOM 181602 / DAOM 197198 / MUCL 43194) TaxID=747089 RepID=A0A2P4QCB3_RHIID|nr:kinase-like domain-containing protein [Rhizophagus irregularis DAOM 181602=DAOM 197198]POG75283.1 kinase-like domain-containing protein [Rhizophagus irregularis DAOM 181602=DAOM 197198]|eukprot:XP_025182149.1 kinase-like domain-containing protein [Rhizophagus irregularis DAOM 181602=DAOM 197198]
MSYDENQSVNAAIIRAIALMDYNICNNIHKQFEFVRQTLLDDNSLTENEKYEAKLIYTKVYDSYKIMNNDGSKRICDNCNQECLATLYCELCIRNYLKTKFSNWTSGNVNIDNLIKECQMETLKPNKIMEWIPYNNLKNIKYLTKGGFSEIYTAIWMDGAQKLENVNNASQSWLEEAKSHLTLSTKYPNIVQCYGLTQDPSNGNYMLVMNEMDTNLRKYLQQNHRQLTWKERIQIAVNVIKSVRIIHKENAIHRDLHSGNILFKTRFYISDLGFYGPADKPLKSIYGNLPYVAPEAIIGKEQTFKSDIYSIAMLMWEISSGQPPFINYDNDYDLAMNIVNGIRPKIEPGTPSEYKNLMKQCWDADPSNRPDINTLRKKINEINLFYQKELDELLTQPEENNSFEIEHHTSRELEGMNYF